MYVTADVLAAAQAEVGGGPELRWEIPILEDEWRSVRASQRRERAHDITFFILARPEEAPAEPADPAWASPPAAVPTRNALPRLPSVPEGLLADEPPPDPPAADLLAPCIAVIRKPAHPPGGYRAPSGGAEPGEGLLAAACREAKEETGLVIEPLRYLLTIRVRFLAAGEGEPKEAGIPLEPIDWASYLLAARVRGAIGEDGRLRDRPPWSLHPQDRREIAHARWLTPAQLQGPVRRVLWQSGRGLFRYRVHLTDAALRRLEDLSLLSLDKI